MASWNGTRSDDGKCMPAASKLGEEELFPSVLLSLRNPVLAHATGEVHSRGTAVTFKFQEKKFFAFSNMSEMIPDTSENPGHSVLVTSGFVSRRFVIVLFLF